MKNKPEQFCILITSIGSTGAQSLVKVFRTYKKRGLKLLGCDADAKTIGRHFVDEFFNVPYADKHNYADELLKICLNQHVDMLIPVMEKELEVVAENRTDFLKYRPVVSDIGVIRTCNDKLLTEAFLRRISIPTPILYQSVSETNFPLIAKPRIGTGSRGINIFMDKSHLNCQEITTDHIVQEYIVGKEYTVDAYTTLRGEFVGAVPRQRLAIKGGLSVHTITVDYPALIDYTRKIAEALPIIGPANIQFIVSEQADIFCTDINPRFGGGYITSIQAGLNAPFFLIDEAMGDPICYSTYKKGLRMLRYWEEIYES